MTKEPSTLLFVSISGWLGGPGRSLASVLAHLPEDMDAVLACPPGGDLLAAVKERTDLKGYLPLVRRPGPVPDPLGRVRSIVRLIAWAMQNRRRLLAIHANGYSELNIVAPAAILSGTPVVVWLHGSEIGRWHRRLGRLWRVALGPLVMAVSQIAAETAIGSGLAAADEIRIVPNPIDPEDCLAGPRNETTATDRMVVGYVAAAKRRKGFRLLPRIIDKVGDAPIRWVVFASRPEDRTTPDEPVWSHLEALGPKVSFDRWRTRVADAYRVCDVVLCPSLIESFSRVPAEAMLNGLPVVASDIEPHRALLAGRQPAGLLFPVEVPDLAANHIRRLADDPDLRAALGRAGRSRAAAFAPDRIVAELADLYRQARVSHNSRWYRHVDARAGLTRRRQ
jgi:glycosyltransferase involved in cell wall biosynthesis